MNRAFLLHLLLALPLAGQNFRAEIDQARATRQRFENLAFTERIEPHWLQDNVRFWYEVKTTAGTPRFVLVNAETGTRQPAFDHARLSASLSAAAVQDAQDLRLTRLRFEKDAFVFRIRGQWWRCRTEDYQVHPLEGPPAAEAPPVATLRTGPETRIDFRNDTDGEVQLYWLDTTGQRRPYGSLQPSEERQQHTYAGHVWLALNAQNELLSWFEAETTPTLASIRPHNGTPQPHRPAPRRRQRAGQSAQSPDGKWEASINDNNLHVRSVEDQEVVFSTEDGTAANGYVPRFYWSPDSGKLVGIQRREGEKREVHLVESSPRDQVQPKLITYEYAKPGDRIDEDSLVLIHAATRRSVPIAKDLFPNPWSLTQLQWLPDSTEFLFLYNERGHQRLRLIAVNAADGSTRVVIEEQSRTFVDYAGKLFLQLLPDTREIIWMSERDGWNHLYLFDSTTGSLKNQITQGHWVVRQIDEVDADRRQIWFRAGGLDAEQDPYYVHYCRIDFDGSNLTRLTHGNGHHTAQFSPDRRFLIDTWSRVDAPPVIQLRRADTGSLVCLLEQEDTSPLHEAGWRAPEPFAAKGRDGSTDIYGVIFRPTHFNPNKQYPILEQIYAGPQGAYVPKSFRPFHRPQELAELGFIVVQIDGMGTSHRSKRFHDVCWKNLGDAGFPDRIAWMRAAAARYPQFDLARVGVYGGSAGGQNALRALLAHGDFYRAAAADCGCHDNRMDKIWWNELWMGWPIGPHYEEQSNVTQAHRLQGKVLLTVGELDRNVDPASTMQVVDALIRADKDFELLIVPGAGHGVGESPYAARRRAEFFVRHLRERAPELAREGSPPGLR